MSKTLAPPSAEEVFAVGVVWAPICSIVVALRFAARRYQRAGVRADDWLTLPALIGTLGICAAMIYGSVTHSLANPTPQPAPGEDPLVFQDFKISTVKKIVWISEMIQCVSLSCTKLSCLFFYRRIFYTGHRGQIHYITMALIVTTALWGAIFLVALGSECRGYIAAWWTDIKTLDTYCAASLPIEAAFAVSDTAVDLVILVLPMILVTNLQLSFPRKLAVIAILCLGALAVAASLVRMIIFVQAVIQLSSDYASTGADDSIPTTGVYWATIESGVALTATCLPTFYSVGKEIFKQIALSSFKSSQKSNTAGFSKKSPSTLRRQPRWPFSVLGGTDTAKSGQGTGTSAVEDDWSAHNAIPMISELPRVAQIETHAEAFTAGSHSDREELDHGSMANGEIRVEKQIEQTETIASRV